MRKGILMGLGLALSLAGAAAAQQPSDSAGKHRGGRSERFEGHRRGPEGRAYGRLFRDITLTDAQKTQLKQLREAQRAEMRASRDSMRRQLEQARDARRKGDTAAARAIVQQHRAAMEQARDRQFAAIRNILTPEQQAQFDKNVAEVKRVAAERDFGRDRRRHEKRGDRGGRSEKP